jgi:uncharacterized protein YqhQ
MAQKFNYGGQAVIEGVMIRGQKVVVTTVRRPNGELATKTRPLPTIFTNWTRRTPLLRGVVVLIEALVLGMQSLLYSANVALEEEEAEISGKWVWLMLIFTLCLATAIFFLIPLFLTKLLHSFITSAVVFNLVEGSIRLGMFIAYLWLITLVPDIKRVFAYHGAEHKAVNAYEAGVPLEVEAVKAHSTAHTRCGTSFLFVVLVIAIIVFTLVGLPSIWLMVLSRILLIPVIAALSYELIYWGNRYHRHGLIRAILAPGLWLQAMTTREPDDSQIEVALASLKRATEVDQSEKKA